MEVYWWCFRKCYVRCWFAISLFSLCINFAVNSVFTLTGPPLIAIFGEKISIFVSSAIYW